MAVSKRRRNAFAALLAAEERLELSVAVALLNASLERAASPVDRRKQPLEQLLAEATADNLGEITQELTKRMWGGGELPACPAFTTVSCAFSGEIRSLDNKRIMPLGKNKAQRSAGCPDGGEQTCPWYDPAGKAAKVQKCQQYWTVDRDGFCRMCSARKSGQCAQSRMKKNGGGPLSGAFPCQPVDQGKGNTIREQISLLDTKIGKWNSVVKRKNKVLRWDPKKLVCGQYRGPDEGQTIDLLIEKAAQPDSKGGDVELPASDSEQQDVDDDKDSAKHPTPLTAVEIAAVLPTAAPEAAAPAVSPEQVLPPAVGDPSPPEKPPVDSELDAFVKLLLGEDAMEPLVPGPCGSVRTLFMTVGDLRAAFSTVHNDAKTALTTLQQDTKALADASTLTPEKTQEVQASAEALLQHLFTSCRKVIECINFRNKCGDPDVNALGARDYLGATLTAAANVLAQNQLFAFEAQKTSSNGDFRKVLYKKATDEPEAFRAAVATTLAEIRRTGETIKGLKDDGFGVKDVVSKEKHPYWVKRLGGFGITIDSMRRKPTYVWNILEDIDEVVSDLEDMQFAVFDWVKAGATDEPNSYVGDDDGEDREWWALLAKPPGEGGLNVYNPLGRYLEIVEEAAEPPSMSEGLCKLEPVGS